MTGDGDVADGDLGENDGQRFGRLPPTAGEREVAGRASRQEVLDFWADRYDVPPEIFDGHTLWEKGAGKIWAYAGEACDPARVEALGMTFLRTRQEHWKPTTDAVQRFGRHATGNVLVLPRERTRRFLRGEAQDVDWDYDWGYLIIAHEIAGGLEPVGVGLYLHGELRSQVPKGRQRDL